MATDVLQQLPTDRLTCVHLVGSESIATYDYASAAGQFAQINGVLAALVFAALVFILDRAYTSDYKSEVRAPLLLLPLAFGVAVLTAYQYSIVNSYALCEIVAALTMIAGPNFAFVVLAILATMATMFAEIGGDGGRSAYWVTVALYAATALLAIGNVAVTVLDMTTTFGLPGDTAMVARHTLMGLSASLVVLGVYYLLFHRSSRNLARSPDTQRVALVVVAVVSALYIVASGVLFAIAAMVPNWAAVDSVEAVGTLLSLVGWTPTVLTGLMAGLLSSLIWWTSRH